MVQYSSFSRARSSAVEQLPLKQLAEGSNPSGLTKKEIKSEVGTALAAHASEDSAIKGKSRVADRRRKEKK